jgi:glycosyltransferase involved in cell wall biosynthesis
VVFLPARGDGWLARQLVRSNVAIEYFHLERPFSPACARSLAAGFRRHAVALAHSHEFSMAVYGAWAARRAGVQHIITMHGSRYYAGRLRRRLAMRAAIAASGRTVAVSNRLAGDLSRDLWVRRPRIATVHNGVREVAPGRATLVDELGLAARDRLAVSVGNLYPVKGHQHLVDALALLSERHPNLHLAIAGRGKLEPALAARAREKGVADRVHLLGLRSDIADVLASADVFVLPSLSEGLPLALLEAMLAGRAIVASDVGEIRTALAQGEAGVLVEAGDPGALARALDRLLRDSEYAHRLAETASCRVRSEYAISRMVGRYREIYEEVLARRAPQPWPEAA